jgi:hypothetical protein
MKYEHPSKWICIHQFYWQLHCCHQHIESLIKYNFLITSKSKERIC